MANLSIQILDLIAFLPSNAIEFLLFFEISQLYSMVKRICNSLQSLRGLPYHLQKGWCLYLLCRGVKFLWKSLFSRHWSDRQYTYWRVKLFSMTMTVCLYWYFTTSSCGNSFWCSISHSLFLLTLSNVFALSIAMFVSMLYSWRFLLFYVFWKQNQCMRGLYGICFVLVHVWFQLFNKFIPLQLMSLLSPFLKINFTLAIDHAFWSFRYFQHIFIAGSCFNT